MSCDCSPAVYDSAGRVLKVGTCPVCLPPGAITWLIESGRQLDLFSDHAALPGPEDFVSLDTHVSVSASESEAVTLIRDKSLEGLSSSDLPF